MFPALTRMPDGTVKQLNPFTGTQVWTVPGRADRPLGIAGETPTPLDPADHTRRCAFCAERQLETPPERARLVRHADGTREILYGLLPHQLGDTQAEFRRIPNLFEILTFDYWRTNYGYELGTQARLRRDTYLADPAGREHVDAMVRRRGASRQAPGDVGAHADGSAAQIAIDGFFGGGHDVIVARRHFRDDAETTADLASSGTLSPQEHRDFVYLTVDSMRELYAANRYAPYVAVFQNWLRPAGASFDHLHKQLVAIDERGHQAGLEIEKVRANPNVYNELAVDLAGYNNLVIAENEHAVAFAGFGHRFPTIEVYSRSAVSEPWHQSDTERDAMSDLLHACHAAAGAAVPCNEEWHTRPVDLDVAMPWRVLIKWRVSTIAGFEGATKVYLNTLSPWDLRDRVVPRLFDLRERGRIAADIRIATECRCERNSLRYAERA